MCFGYTEKGSVCFKAYRLSWYVVQSCNLPLFGLTPVSHRDVVELFIINFPWSRSFSNESAVSNEEHFNLCCCHSVSIKLNLNGQHHYRSKLYFKTLSNIKVTPNLAVKYLRLLDPETLKNWQNTNIDIFLIQLYPHGSFCWISNAVKTNTNSSV